MNDLLSPLTLHLLELFTAPDGALRDVRFPDADGERLTVAVEEARVAREALARAEAAVDAARATLAEKQRAIAHQTERTLAYTRIYAADRPELRAAIDAVAALQARGPGRPRKAKSDANVASEPAVTSAAE
jgi:hypothetical protein